MNSKKSLIVLITGASGTGKTSLTKALKEQDPHQLSVHYFDDIGIPDTQEMINTYGSIEKWQEETTKIWIRKLSELNEEIIILEGSFNPSFAISELKTLGTQDYLLICCHTEQKVREKRLLELRQQPELITQDMENYAQFLRLKTLELKGIILNTTDKSLSQLVKKIKTLIEDKLNRVSTI